MTYLRLLQKLNNLFYTIFKDASFVISFQAYINTKRHEKDIPDKNEIIYIDEDLNEYVQ